MPAPAPAKKSTTPRGKKAEAPHTLDKTPTPVSHDQAVVNARIAAATAILSPYKLISHSAVTGALPTWLEDARNKLRSLLSDAKAVAASKVEGAKQAAKDAAADIADAAKRAWKSATDTTGGVIDDLKALAKEAAEMAGKVALGSVAALGILYLVMSSKKGT